MHLNKHANGSYTFFQVTSLGVAVTKDQSVTSPFQPHIQCGLHLKQVLETLR